MFYREAGKLYAPASELTFDRGDDGSGRAEDVHRVEALVFADDGLQDAQQLPETLVDSVVEAVLVLWKVTFLQLTPS